MLDDLAGGVFRFIFQIFVAAVCFYTGEILLYVITFGRRKPRWDYYNDAPASKWVILTEISFILGAAFWIILAIYVVKAII